MMHTDSALIQRATIDEVEGKRRHALNLHAAAFDALAAAFVASTAAVQGQPHTGHAGAAACLLGKDDRMPHNADPRAFYLETCRKDLDRNVWRFLLDFMGLERIMDRTALEQFQQQLREDPPEATAENCAATFAQLIQDRGLIFQRGIALAFSGLDRRFRSHDGFKIGARICLTSALSNWGSWSRNQDATIRDVERAFYQLDGKEQPDRSGGILGTFETARREEIRISGRSLERHAFEAEDDLFKIRSFKNGNVHLWFKRNDLVEQVNLVLADYYGANLGASPDAADVKSSQAVGFAKNFGLFETPEALALRVLSDAGVMTPATWGGQRPYDRLTVLEPSAGRGRIAFPAIKAGHDVTCVEYQPELCRTLSIGGARRVIEANFLELTPEALGTFDRVVMNPPFDRTRDIDHVTHAFRFLKPGGRLCAIMSAGTAYREDKKTEAFRALVERMRGDIRDLPAGSFTESGTNVNTVIVTMNAPRPAA